MLILTCQSPAASRRKIRSHLHVGLSPPCGKADVSNGLGAGQAVRLDGRLHAIDELDLCKGKVFGHAVQGNQRAGVSRDRIGRSKEPFNQWHHPQAVQHEDSRAPAGYPGARYRDMECGVHQAAVLLDLTEHGVGESRRDSWLFPLKRRAMLLCYANQSIGVATVCRYGSKADDTLTAAQGLLAGE